MTDGINAPQVTAWLVEHIDGARAPFTFKLISGGRSNLTFQVTDAAGRKLVLRRPPMSHVLPTAHDMSREHRIISALWDTPVPVPRALGFCADEAVNGRPFYVMDFVEGHILRVRAQTEAVLDEAARKVAGNDLVDVLAAIHAVDVDAAGLGALGRREGYISRQLRRWHGQFQQSQEQARAAGVHRPLPEVDEAHRLLTERVPEQRGAAIVHGDYRLDNTLVSGEGRVQAVLDWELCTLGDPLADVGTLLMYWAEPTSGPSPSDPVDATAAPAATALPGFPTRAELAARYAATSGRDLGSLNLYLAFAHWRLACILEGVYVRYAARAMGADGSADGIGSAGYADRAEENAHRALELLRAS